MQSAHTVKLKVLSWVRLSVTSELPFPSPGDLPKAGMEPRSPALQADSSPDEPPGKPPQLMIKKAISPGEKLAKL